MVDLGSDDFLDSDDDEFFREASNHFLDFELNSESTLSKDTDVPSDQSQTVVSSYFVSPSSKAAENEIVPESTTLTLSTENSSKSDVLDKNNTPSCQVPSDACANAVSKENSMTPKLTEKQDNFVYKRISSLISENSNRTAASASTSSGSRVSNIFPDSLIYENSDKTAAIASTSSGIRASNTFPDSLTPKISNKTVAIASTSSGSSVSNAFPDSNTSSTSIISPFINNRFTPGFTPKAKRRKFPGPAGFLESVDETKVTDENDSNKMLTFDMEFQNVVSSQYTPEHLTLSSWQKLQAAVSSCSNLLSTAKYYSIQRVLSESSKKKLPKHMVVPVLCVLLKKLNDKGTTTIPVLMDDTGEIHGKIDAEVLTLYKEFLVEGTAFILNKVTFLCNVLILKSQNIVSMYHPNGTEKHLLRLESILETSEPLKPMNCECLKLSIVKNSLYKTPSNHTPINHTPACISHSQKKFSNVTTTFRTPQNNISDSEKSNHISKVKNSSSYYSSRNNTPNKNASSSHFEQSSSNSELSSHSHGTSMRSNAFLEKLLDEADGMDEFDQLLGNIDENSFMENL